MASLQVWVYGMESSFKEVFRVNLKIYDGWKSLEMLMFSINQYFTFKGPTARYSIENLSKISIHSFFEEI